MGLEAENVLPFGKLVQGREFGDAGPAIQRIGLELDLLFLGQALAAGRRPRLPKARRRRARPR
jgi:hypothetical protein